MPPPTDWAIAETRRLTPEIRLRCRGADIDIHDERWPAFLGGQPTGSSVVTWFGPRPDVLDPGMFEPGFPRRVFG